jgi:hypothetical protein
MPDIVLSANDAPIRALEVLQPSDTREFLRTVLY